MIRAVFVKNKLLFLLIIIFILAEVIVNPIANIPLNDDWTYAETVKASLASGTIETNTLSSASLFTHVVWGTLFTKIFGFSFTVLRFSTLISALISVFFLNKIIIYVTNNKLAGFIGCLVLLFNPIYFNVSNTFMTDVNFITLFILCIYFAFEFYRTQKIYALVLVFVFSTLAVLLRQYGIIIPFCFAFSCLFLRDKRWLFVGLSVALSFAVIMIFKQYENHLREVLPANSGYKFSSDNHLTDPSVLWRLINNIENRYIVLLLHVLVYGFPFIAIFMISLLRSFRWYVFISVAVVSVLFTHILFKDLGFPMGNIFCNMFLGAETFFQTFENGLHYELQHFSESFEIASVIVKYLFSSGTITCLILMTVRLIRDRTTIFPESSLVLLIALIFSYAFMVLITEGFFDRYQIPLVALCIILCALLSKGLVVDPKISVMPLFLFFYISVFGTKDYIELNRKRWEAFNFVKDRLGVGAVYINAGYEVSGWGWGDPSLWAGFMSAQDHYFLIQYKGAPGYRMIREYEFQRYFPYKKDKIFIFRNLRKTRKI